MKAELKTDACIICGRKVQRRELGEVPAVGEAPQVFTGAASENTSDREQHLEKVDWSASSNALTSGPKKRGVWPRLSSGRGLRVNPLLDGRGYRSNS
jgi:hypothetical protein